MSSRYAAARPKRAGESFARTHHGEDDSGEAGGPAAKKRVKFDVRNPSSLAPDSRDDDDDVLDADVIGRGGGGATKRGAVNIDGYDSDSDNETFAVRAEARGSGKKGKDGEVDIADQLDNYDKNLRSGASVEEEEEEEDMFADDNEDEAENGDPAAPDTTPTGRKGKEVRFLDADKIEGQVETSKSGGHIRINDEDSSDDEEDVEAAIQGEGVDEEVGAGGLKRHAPKIDAFNMRDEQEDGAFDETGNYIRKAVDPDAVHDKWLDGVSKKDMKKAAAAHEKREEELRQKRKEDDNIITADVLRALILRLDKGETALEALARLGKGQKKEKKVPLWKLKKQQKNGDDSMEVDQKKEPEDPEQVKIKEAIGDITEAADRLLGRDYRDIYDTEREMLIREYQKETGESWVEPSLWGKSNASAAGKMWEYRWTDGRDTAVQGPYDGPTMKAWQDAGYFEGVEFRQVGEDGWTFVAGFV